MKPTKEQLADPKWWDENAKPEDKYCYQCERSGGYFFSNILEYGLPKYTVIADRPEPNWVPEVGEMCEVWVENVGYWAKITVLAVDKDTIVWRNGTDRKSYRGTRISDARPIKTQREELVDIVYSNNGNPAELIADSILARFDLTKNGGE